MKKLRIAVLMHKDLVPPKDTYGIDTSKMEWKTEFDIMDTLEEMGHTLQPIGIYDKLQDIRKAIDSFEPDIVFNLLEEFDGLSTMDHNIVSYLELLKVPYTGCNPRGMMLARDKALSKNILSFHDIPVPKYFLCPRGQKPKMPKTMHYPVFVKSQIEDASLGISQASVIDNVAALKKRIHYLHTQLKTDAIIEEFIDGRELYVAVLGNQTVKTFPVWEMKFRKTPAHVIRIATRKAKWDDAYRKRYGIKSGRASKLDAKLEAKIADLCNRAYKSLYMTGYARFDLRLTKGGDVYIIEANPNPGIAYGEDYPESADLVGMSYEQLMAKILSLGLSWHKQQTTD